MKRIITGALIGAALAATLILYVQPENTVANRATEVLLVLSFSLIAALISGAIQDRRRSDDPRIRDYQDELIQWAKQAAADRKLLIQTTEKLVAAENSNSALRAEIVRQDKALAEAQEEIRRATNTAADLQHVIRYKDDDMTAIKETRDLLEKELKQQISMYQQLSEELAVTKTNLQSARKQLGHA